MPVGYLYCKGNPRTDWMMSPAPEPALSGRRVPYPQGKVLGGCNSINGMIYMRRQAADYDHWRQLGNVGWSRHENGGENVGHGSGGMSPRRAA